MKKLLSIILLLSVFTIVNAQKCYPDNPDSKEDVQKTLETFSYPFVVIAKLENPTRACLKDDTGQVLTFHGNNIYYNVQIEDTIFDFMQLFGYITAESHTWKITKNLLINEFR